MISSATGVTFGGFRVRVALFCVAGVALRDIQTCFVTCRKMSKAVLCGRRNTFVSFSEDALQFRGRRLFGHVHLHFAWQAQHLRGVVLRGFAKSHCQGCVKCDTVQIIANCVAGVAFLDVLILTEASHETSILR